jgi:plastocyanin
MAMNKVMGFVLALQLLLAGCAATPSTSMVRQSGMMQGQSDMMSGERDMMQGQGGMLQDQGAVATDQGTNSTGAHKSSQTQQRVTLKILPDAKRGPDGRKHDAFFPANFTLHQGETVALRIENYDTMLHSLTSVKQGLRLNIQAKGTRQQGVPAVTTVTFTPTVAGSYQWFYADPCDLSNGGWAMSHDDFMRGQITVRGGAG